MFNNKKIISFSGIDGCGKTTQINILYKKLKKKNKVKLIHLFAKGSSIHSKVENNILFKFIIYQLKKLNIKFLGVRIKFYIAICIFFLESWIFYFKIIFFEKKNYILIDRYYYDYFVNQISNEARKAKTYVIFNKYYPKLDCSLFFDVNERTSYKRKGEYNLKKLKKMRQYFKICSKLVNGTNINGSRKIDDISKQIETAITKL
jgi:thymidylate kinase